MGPDDVVQRVHPDFVASAYADCLILKDGRMFLQKDYIYTVEPNHVVSYVSRKSTGEYKHGYLMPSKHAYPNVPNPHLIPVHTYAGTDTFNEKDLKHWDKEDLAEFPNSAIPARHGHETDDGLSAWHTFVNLNRDVASAWRDAQSALVGA